MAISLHRLPSLDLLRGFVAVGRHMSITLAARDLCLTQSAVSRQVKALEEAVGAPLLVRKYRAIAFTPQGEQLFHTADAALQQLQDRIGILRESGAGRPVGIACSIGVAGLWLLPRLHLLRKADPDIEIRISASDTVTDLRQDGLDLAIRYCANESAPSGAIRLFEETIRPVAHPSAGIAHLASGADISDLVLLDFEGPYRPWLRWEEWLDYQGWRDCRPKRIMRFNHYDQVIHAAVAGQGVALGRLRMIDTFLGDGRLKVIDGPQKEFPNTYGYWLIVGSKNPSPQVQAVVRWIRTQAGRTRKSTFAFPALMQNTPIS